MLLPDRHATIVSRSYAGDASEMGRPAAFSFSRIECGVSHQPHTWYDNYVKISTKASAAGNTVTDLSGPDALERFRKEARAFTAKATRSRKSAMDTLISEGIYTKTGRLTKRYR